MTQFLQRSISTPPPASARPSLPFGSLIVPCQGQGGATPPCLGGLVTSYDTEREECPPGAGNAGNARKAGFALASRSGGHEAPTPRNVVEGKSLRPYARFCPPRQAADGGVARHIDDFEPFQLSVAAECLRRTPLKI
jgi:hypothetical protein